MPRDKRGWRVAPAPDGRGMPEEHKPQPPHRLRGFWIFCRRAARDQLAVGARLPARRASRGSRCRSAPTSSQQVDAATSSRSRRKSDTIQGTFDGQAALPAERQQGDADDAVLDPGAVVLEQRRADRSCCRPRTSRSTPSRPESGHLAAGRDPARLRPDAAAGRPVRAARAPRRSAGPAGSAGSATSAARRRGGSTPRRSASRSTTSPGSTRPRPS